MKRRQSVFAVLALSASLSASVSAQGINSYGGSWQNIGTPGTNSGNQYWNNSSHDGPACNIGYYVKDASYGPCDSQIPSPFTAPLGWGASASYLALSTPSLTVGVVFDFQPGWYSVEYRGTVAGANPLRNFGVISNDLSVNHTFGSTAPETFTFFSATNWAFFLEPYTPTGPNWNSRNDRQFAVFSPTANGDLSSTWLVGAEDNACTAIGTGCSRVSDFDFNDKFALVRVVPEPSTYVLMGSGLLALAGFARRRRSA